MTSRGRRDLRAWCDGKPAARRLCDERSTGPASARRHAAARRRCLLRQPQFERRDWLSGAPSQDAECGAVDRRRRGTARHRRPAGRIRRGHGGDSSADLFVHPAAVPAGGAGLRAALAAASARRTPTRRSSMAPPTTMRASPSHRPTTTAACWSSRPFDCGMRRHDDALPRSAVEGRPATRRGARHRPLAADGAHDPRTVCDGHGDARAADVGQRPLQEQAFQAARIRDRAGAWQSGSRWATMANQRSCRRRARSDRARHGLHTYACRMYYDTSAGRRVPDAAQVGPALPRCISSSNRPAIRTVQRTHTQSSTCCCRRSRPAGRVAESRELPTDTRRLGAENAD